MLRVFRNTDKKRTVKETAEVTKDELKLYRWQKQYIELLKDEIKTLNRKLTSVKSQKINDMPKSQSGKDVADAIIKLMGDIDDRKNKIRNAEQKMRDVEDFIDGVAVIPHRLIMRYRYVEGLKWEEIGAQMTYSERQIRRIHDKIMKDVR